MAARHRVTAGRHLGAGNLVRLTQDFWVYNNPCPSGNCNEGPTCDNNDPLNCCDDILLGTGLGDIDNTKSAEDVRLAGGTAAFHQTNGGVEFDGLFALGAINLIVPSHTQTFSENRNAHNDAAGDHSPVMNISHNLAYARYRKGMKVHDPMPNVTYTDMKKIIGLTPAMSMGESNGHIDSLQTVNNSGGIDHSFDNIQPDVVEDAPSLAIDPRLQSKLDTTGRQLPNIQGSDVTYYGEAIDAYNLTSGDILEPNDPNPPEVLGGTELECDNCGNCQECRTTICTGCDSCCNCCSYRCANLGGHCKGTLLCDCNGGGGGDPPVDCGTCPCGCDDSGEACIEQVIKECKCGVEICSTCTVCPDEVCPQCNACGCNGTQCGQPDPCDSGCGDPCSGCDTACGPNSCDTCPPPDGVCRTLDCNGVCGGPGCDGTVLCCDPDGSACIKCPPCPLSSSAQIESGALTSLKGNYRGKDLVPIAYFNHDLNVGLDYGSSNGSAVGPRDTVMSCVLELTIADVYGRIPVTGAAPYVKPLKLTVYKSNKTIDTSTVSCDLYSNGNDWTSDSGRNATDRNLTAVSSITIGEDTKPLDKIAFDLTSLARDAVQNNESVLNFMIEASEWFDESTGLKAAPLAEQPAMLLKFYREGTHRPKIKTNVNQGLRPTTQRLNPAVLRRRQITAGQ